MEEGCRKPVLRICCIGSRHDERTNLFYFAYRPFHNTLPSYLFYVPSLSQYTPVLFILRTVPFTIHSRLFYFTYRPFHNTLPSFLFYVPSLSQYTPVFFILHTLPFRIHSRLFYFTYPPYHSTLPSYLSASLCTSQTLTTHHPILKQDALE